LAKRNQPKITLAKKGEQPMKKQNAKEDIQKLLSCFSEVFSRPSFKIFCSFIIGFIQLGKEIHTSSMVQSLTCSFVHRSVSSFTRFLGKNVWVVEEVAEIALQQFFHILRIKANEDLFFIVDDTIVKKTGKNMPGCAWHKDHAHNMANIFGHQWVLSAVLYKDFLLPLWAKLYHPKGTRGCGQFQSKITLAKKIFRTLKLPTPCNLYILVDSWYWAKEVAQCCERCGYHMISQLKSNSVIWINKTRTKVKTLGTVSSVYRETSIFLYGKNKTLKISKFIGVIKNIGEVAVIVVKEKRKKPRYLVSTNIHLSAIEVVKYYANRWKIEQMIKDLKQRLGFGDYQVRNPKAIYRHVALALLSFCVLILFKIIQWLRDKNVFLHLSIRLLAFYFRKYILLENIMVTLKTMKIQFKQNILDSYLEQLWI
jgi:SRSO17 transposase